MSTQPCAQMRHGPILKDMIMNHLVPCPNCGEPFCPDCGEHYSGQVGGPPPGTVQIDDAYCVPTDGLAYGAFLNPPYGTSDPKFEWQYNALLKSLQDRYNLKRAYAGLPKQPVQFDFDLVVTGAARTDVKVSGAAALFLKNRRDANTAAHFGKEIFGGWYMGAFAVHSWHVAQARSDALPLSDSNTKQETAAKYEYIASLATTDQGGDNPFSVALAPFVAIAHVEAQYSENMKDNGYRACLKSISNVLGRRINSLNETHVQLLALIDEQIKRDKYAGMTVSTGLKGFTPLVNANTPAAATPMQFNPYSTSVGTRSTRRR